MSSRFHPFQTAPGHWLTAGPGGGTVPGAGASMMNQRRTITRNLNVAKYIIDVYLERGAADFADQLTKFLTHHARLTGARTAEFERTAQDLVACCLAQLYPLEPEAVLRHQAALLPAFLNEPDTDRRIARLADALTRFLAEFHQPGPAEPLATRVRRQLKEATDDDLRQLTVDSLAEHFQYNRNYLADKFRHETGGTLQDALAGEKMNRAFQLLTRRDTPLTVKEVAERLGFSDPAHFRKLFRLRYGYLPSDIR